MRATNGRGFAATSDDASRQNPRHLRQRYTTSSSSSSSRLHRCRGYVTIAQLAIGTCVLEYYTEKNYR